MQCSDAGMGAGMVLGWVQGLGAGMMPHWMQGSDAGMGASVGAGLPHLPPFSGQGAINAFAPSAASWLKPPPPRERSCRPRYLTRVYWHNHRSKLACLGGYAGLNLLLFALAALRHASLGGWMAVARGCGQCLNFNCTFLAVSAGSWAAGGILSSRGAWSDGYLGYLQSYLHRDFSPEPGDLLRAVMEPVDFCSCGTGLSPPLNNYI